MLYVKRQKKQIIAHKKMIRLEGSEIKQQFYCSIYCDFFIAIICNIFYVRLKIYVDTCKNVLQIVGKCYRNLKNQKNYCTNCFIGLADFSVPKGGFFLWIKVRGIENTWKMIMQRGVTEGVIMAPGAAFMKDSTKPCNTIRASFSKASYQEMDLVF